MFMFECSGNGYLERGKRYPTPPLTSQHDIRSDKLAIGKLKIESKNKLVWTLIDSRTRETLDSLTLTKKDSTIFRNPNIQKRAIR